MLMDEVRGEAFLGQQPQGMCDSLVPARMGVISRVSPKALKRRQPVDLARQILAISLSFAAFILAAFIGLLFHDALLKP